MPNDALCPSRRDFIRASAASVGSVALAGAFESFLARSAHGEARSAPSGYGPPIPVKDETTGLELLGLPEGFRYLSFGWTGDKMSDGRRTPGSHDGMAVIKAEGDVITLCRNHERKGVGRPMGDRRITYDSKAIGGCSNLKFDTRQGRWLEARPSLSGTLKNCAGGPTPWGSWLSCEEVVLSPGDVDYGKRFNLDREHGWIFEVPAEGAARPIPLKEMGRFVHEAIAVDPDTSDVYETEDAGTAGLYRFIPHEKQVLSKGGRLQMVKVLGRPDLRKGCRMGETLDAEWVDIRDPHRGHSPGTKDKHGVFQQGKDQGATTFGRLEGCWYGNGVVYFVSTSGGDTGNGQIWQYDPKASQVKLVFESPDAKVLDSPDNIAVSPRGGIVLCEDGDYVPQRLHGLTRNGHIFPFAANNIVLRGERNDIRGDFRKEEWAGATFSPDGKWLFVNIQTPGLTFAITGPWEDGLL